jgi:hypothetical protein
MRWRERERSLASETEGILAAVGVDDFNAERRERNAHRDEVRAQVVDDEDGRRTGDYVSIAPRKCAVVPNYEARTAERAVPVDAEAGRGAHSDEPRSVPAARAGTCEFADRHARSRRDGLPGSDCFVAQEPSRSMNSGPVAALLVVLLPRLALADAPPFK